MRRQAADPQFGRLVRTMHRLIKCVHHLQNVTPKDNTEGPKMISRMVEILSSMIKPFAPTAHTIQMISGNAINWAYNTVTILTEHYQNNLSVILEELSDFLIPDWKSAFQVAVRWATRNLPRLSQDVVDHTEALIAARVTSAVSRQGQDRPQGVLEASNGTQTQVDVTAQIQTQTQRAPKQPRTKPSVATMTDPTSRDWDEHFLQVETPQPCRGEKRQDQRPRMKRGILLREEPVQNSTHTKDVGAKLDRLEAEQQREEFQTRQNLKSPAASGRQNRSPALTRVLVHKDLSSDDEEDVFEDPSLILDPQLFCNP